MRLETIELSEPVGPTATVRVGAFFELAKPRILILVLVATAAGFYLAMPGGAEPASWVRLVHVLIGTALAVAGSNALNQVLEAEHDARMERTAGRPIPSGRLGATEALAFGVATSVVGVVYLSALTFPLVGVLTAVSFINYVFVYTPLKRLTSYCVFVGAVSGALPPVIGWAAAAGTLGTEPWLLFGILFFWQLPHFASIAWLYRADYAAGGYPMLPVVDPRGLRCDLHLMTYTVALLLVSVLPVLRGTAGPAYGLGAMILGTAFLLCGGAFVRNKTPRSARCHILASITYLPLLFGIMMLDKAWAV